MVIEAMDSDEWDRFQFQHEPEEGSGGAIQCACGWPSRKDIDDADGFPSHVEHVISLYIEKVRVGLRVRYE